MSTSSSINKGAKQAWERLLDCVFPRTCVVCGRLLENSLPGFACPPCRDSIAWIEEPFCGVCGVPIYGSIGGEVTCAACRGRHPEFRRCRSLFLYTGAGARIVHALKYEGGLWLHAEIQQLLLVDPSWRDYFAGTRLVPVPLHPARQRSRGYNQADIIARAVERVVPGTVRCPLLRRVRKTPSQTFLSREERHLNMRGAFSTRKPVPAGPVVLIDDVHTTGATLNAAAMALVKAGVPAGDISAFTLAHG